MREVILEKNSQYRMMLSKDLGAFSGFLFDVGVKKIMVGDEGALSEKEKEKIAKILKKRRKEVLSEKGEEDLHTEMQYHLLKIGHALGYDVIRRQCRLNWCLRVFFQSEVLEFDFHRLTLMELEPQIS